MSLGGIISTVGDTGEMLKDRLSEVNTGDSIFIIHPEAGGRKRAVYHVNIIHLLDEVFKYNATAFLSIDQERFFNRFVKEANEVYQNIDEGKEDPFKNMSKVMRTLDKFLAGYTGENSGRYAR